MYTWLQDKYFIHLHEVSFTILTIFFAQNWHLTLKTFTPFHSTRNTVAMLYFMLLWLGNVCVFPNVTTVHFQNRFELIRATAKVQFLSHAHAQALCKSVVWLWLKMCVHCEFIKTPRAYIDYPNNLAKSLGKIQNFKFR